MKEILPLVQLQQEGDTIIATIGGFDLEYSGERYGRDGYRYSIMLIRTGEEHEIELSVTVTPLGTISRLERAFDDFEGERERYRQRLADARRRLASYRSREDGEFAFAADLAEKRRQLAEVEKALATDVEGAGESASSMMREEGKARSQIGQAGNADAQAPPARSQPVVLRRAVSPACPAWQGCSAAVVPVRPLRGAGGCLREEDEEGPARRGPRTPNRRNPMQLIKIDPRALNENPDRMRQTKSTPQADALLLATIKAVGIVQPPVITPETGGGNGYVINAGHRRVKQAIAAGLEEIDVLVDEAANDNGAMRSMIENIAREALNPVDQWRAIERLVALGWTEEAIGVALTLPVRQIRKLRLLANVLPAMLDHMAKGDMPDERQLRTIASASLDEQKEVWKKHKPPRRIRRCCGGAWRRP